MKITLSTVCLLSLLSLTQGGIRGNDQNNNDIDESNNNNNENVVNVVEAEIQAHRRLGGQMITNPDTNQGGAAQNVPFERNSGSCIDATSAYQSSSFLQSQFPSVQVFRNFCGPQGTCMGGQEGCCRFTFGSALECDLERNFFTATCICNEFTADPRNDPVSSPSAVDVNQTFPPTMAPSPISENCQRFNASSPFALKPPDNPYRPFGQNCTVDSHCPISNQTNSKCCLSNYCLCLTDSIAPTMNLPCVGDDFMSME